MCVYTQTYIYMYIYIYILCNLYIYILCNLKQFMNLLIFSFICLKKSSNDNYQFHIFYHINQIYRISLLYMCIMFTDAKVSDCCG